jgi:hypothetical protein
VAVEKNFEAFLRLKVPGSKIAVGTGPTTVGLERAYRHAWFLGCYAASRSPAIMERRTFSCFPAAPMFSASQAGGTRVGSPGRCLSGERARRHHHRSMIDVLDEDLGKAALACLDLPPEAPRRQAMRVSWEGTARAFRYNILAANRAAVADLG